MKKNQTICFNIKSSWHGISRMYNEQGVKHGMTMSTGYILLNIEKEGTPATKIAPMLGMEVHSLSRTLKNLEEQGLIKRVQEEKDKRMVKIFLTDLGKEKREIAKKVVKTFNNAIKERIGEEKLKAFLEVVNEVNIIIEKKEIY